MRLLIKLFKILSMCYLSNHSTLKSDFFLERRVLLLKAQFFIHQIPSFIGNDTVKRSSPQPQFQSLCFQVVSS